ncbi:MAG: membrane protein insertase YidC [Methylococcaceae bacterium]|nr:membrane protein insertase YidC [Methylococcaceae bacterium]MDZ4156955.1 membrane protein insertase YidC [Methylococcales bacterium]MDP2393997.1 membrane protein insertase YidC [Methylococcaceae bacterium]MDP3018539.1 membrane protein insertase YidC [Methylococcaceae bacterium]MDP3391294.1 membrane protein insertase YidC [Methylococcaceae bacterium]
MDNIRFVLIVTFAMLVFMLQQAWQADYGPKPQVAEVVTSEAVSTKEDLPATAANTAQTQTEQQTGEAPTAPKVAVSNNLITVKTDVIALQIDLQGGSITNLDLLNYPVEKENTVVNTLRSLVGLSVPEINSAPVRLFNNNQEKLFLAQSGLIAAPGQTAPDHYTPFTSQQTSYSLQPGQDSLVVPITWTDGNGLVVTKSFTFKPGSYEITLAQKVSNQSGKIWSGRQYNQLVRAPDQTTGGMLTGGMRAYTGGVISTLKEKYKKISFDDMTDENLDVTSQGGWTAIIQHYFASAWIPPAEQENHFYTKALSDGRYVIGSISPMTNVEPNADTQFVSQLFAGPKIQPMMEKIAPGLELTVDYSVLTIIGKPIYWLLNQIHSVTNNWGWAIIGVTLVIKLLFFPLSQASYKSMAKMRKIQPRLKELQERFADDRPRFNTEMMAMYKKEKVNPLGGCLPILVQIPVFMALYWVLSETVEFRQTPFILWIQDMSIEDPLYILPIIMGITMKIQQSLNPAPIDPVQAKVMKMFPIVFTVFFLFFPAGLVLYWVVNNTLSILQQWYITKHVLEDDAHAHHKAH